MFKKSKHLKWFEVSYQTEPPFTNRIHLVAFDETDAIKRFQEKKYSCEGKIDVKRV